MTKAIATERKSNFTESLRPEVTDTGTFTASWKMRQAKKPCRSTQELSKARNVGISSNGKKSTSHD